MEEVGRIKDRDFCVSRYQSVFGIEPPFGMEVGCLTMRATNPCEGAQLLFRPSPLYLPR